MNCFNCPGTAGTAAGNNLVYLNKIYFDESQRSCPILYTLTTTPETFTQQISFGQMSGNCGCGNGCGCCCGYFNGCSDFTLTETTTFTVTGSHINISAFALSDDTEFDAGDVTVDGFPVTELVLSSGQYVADLSGIMGDITNCPCQPEPVFCSCMPDDRCNLGEGHFFLAQVPGPWVLAATIILEGTASNGSRTCSFRLCLRTVPGDTEAGITIPGTDNFAMYGVNIPCQTAGITPTLVFDFDACASLLNPVLTVTGTGDTAAVTLTSTLVITPEINLKVTKPALFSLNATEVLQECDDVGQCDPCAQNCSCGSGCGCGQQNGGSGCGCGQQNGGSGCGCGQQNAAAQNTGCSSCNPFPSACQCCDTNGYTF